jgi:hypothetical protein
MQLILALMQTGNVAWSIIAGLHIAVIVFNLAVFVFLVFLVTLAWDRK